MQVFVDCVFALLSFFKDSSKEFTRVICSKEWPKERKTFRWTERLTWFWDLVKYYDS